MLLQFVIAVSNHIQALSGGTAMVTVTGVKPGTNASAVVVVTSTTFPDLLNGTSISLQKYLTLLSGNTDPTLIFGPQFADTIIDVSSIKVSYIALTGDFHNLLNAAVHMGTLMPLHFIRTLTTNPIPPPLTLLLLPCIPPKSVKVLLSASGRCALWLAHSIMPIVISSVLGDLMHSIGMPVSCTCLNKAILHLAPSQQYDAYIRSFPMTMCLVDCLPGNQHDMPNCRGDQL